VHIEKINNLDKEFQEDASSVSSLKELEEIRIKYFSRSGLLSQLFDDLKNVSKEDKPVLGKSLNELRNKLSAQFDKIKVDLESNEKKTVHKIDLTLPGIPKQIGSKHILTQTLDQIKEIFKGIGFSVFEGPEIESDYNNFEALNFPEDHPARDMQDTFFLSKKFLLRTHTSPVQIRVMEKYKPPIRAIMPGKCYRNEAVSARSYCMFHQVEGLLVDANVSFGDLKGTLTAFVHQMFDEQTRLRFRPSFFPFTEPSAEVDILCVICRGEGCRVCKRTGWLEILGSGMVHPAVFENVGYDTTRYTGFAFGMGVERIAMLKYGIDDLRKFFENDVRFLSQF